MANPKIAVLMATFNGRKWIQEQIDSILCQKEVDVTLYIADDESSDGTVEFIKDQYGSDARVVSTELLSKVGSASRNFQRLLKSINFENFDFVAFADQDDIWHADKLKVAASCIRFSGSDGYSCAVVARWESGVEKTIRQNKNISKFDYFLEGAGQGCTFVLSRELATKVAFLISQFDDHCAQLHYHDWLVYAVTRSMNRHWYFDDMPHMIYRQHSANDTGARGSLAGILFRFQKLKNGWYFNQVLLIVGLVVKLNPMNESAKFLQKKLAIDRGYLSSMQFSLVNLMNGRRRFVDRMVVSIALLLNWHFVSN